MKENQINRGNNAYSVKGDGITSINIAEIEELDRVLIEANDLINEGFSIFRVTITRLVNSHFIVGQAANNLSYVQQKIEKPWRDFTLARASLSEFLKKAKETNLATDKQYATTFEELAAIDPTKFGL